MLKDPDAAMAHEPVDVLVIGGGPAGSTAAGALALSGLRVLVLERASFPRYHIGESLTPKVEDLFRQIGARSAIDAAGFLRMGGNFECWSRPEPRLQAFQISGRPALGYQVERARFDGILLDLARARGATVRHGITVTGILREGERARGVRWVSSAATARGEIEARFVLDGSGQRGVIGRAFREEDGIQRAISVTRYWRDAGGPPGDARANTVLEATPEGWIWSLPLQNGLRNVTIFAERDPALRTPGASLKKLYHETIAASRHTRGFVEGARKEGQWRIYDSTWYRPRRYAGPGWALIGDAADVIDPLSSQGVYKAMSSALAAAAVARTTLLYPERAQLARRFLEEEQRLFYGELVHAMSIAYRQVPRWLDGAFWRRRDQPHPCAIEPRRPQPAQRAARRDRLRRLGREGAIPGLRFALRPGARVEPRPVMRRGIIEEREVAIVAGRARAVEIDREPRLGVLLSLLDGDAAVRDLVGAYARAAGTPVSAALRERLMESLVDLHEEGVIGILGDDATP